MFCQPGINTKMIKSFAFQYDTVEITTSTKNIAFCVSGIEDQKAPWNKLRLPGDLEPVNYHLDLNIEMDFYRIIGSVTILIKAQLATSVVILHHQPLPYEVSLLF